MDVEMFRHVGGAAKKEEADQTYECVFAEDCPAVSKPQIRGEATSRCYVYFVLVDNERQTCKGIGSLTPSDRKNDTYEIRKCVEEIIGPRVA